MIWPPAQFLHQLANPTSGTLVFEREGCVQGLVHYHLLTLQGREPVRTAMIDLFAGDNLTAAHESASCPISASICANATCISWPRHAMQCSPQQLSWQICSYRCPNISILVFSCRGVDLRHTAKKLEFVTQVAEQTVIYGDISE